MKEAWSETDRIASGRNAWCSAAVQNFSSIQERTQCIFAAASKLWGPLNWDQQNSIVSNVNRSMPLFKEFIIQGEKLCLDGFVIELSNISYGNTLSALCRTTKQVLQAIWEQDPLQQPDWLHGIDSPGWFYSFAGQRLFIFATGPCYDAASSRFAYGCTSTFLLFQPEHSFRRRESPPGSHQISAGHRQIIRTGFDAIGQTYDLSITLGAIEAFRFVKPLKLGDPPIRWWEVSDN